jgi:glycosyltransferase involved in cell wall biosynthesis
MRTLTLISSAANPCGVEAFARGLARALTACDVGGAHATYALTGQPGEKLIVARALADHDALVVNLPLVAWKKHLVAPAQAMAAARRAGKDVVLVLHEWADLDWRRRVSYLGYLPFATRILFSSPLVRDQFAADPSSRLAPRSRGIVPIPPNLRRPVELPRTELAARMVALQAAGHSVVGQFGSIYPKKQPGDVLDIVARLRTLGRPAHALFIGSFIRDASGDPKVAFDARVAALGLEDCVTVTGYIGPDAEVFAAIEACDVMVYRFAEGLTSRRGSVLTCLQTTKPVLVNAPAKHGECDQHPSLLKALAAGRLTLLAVDADVDAFAVAVGAALAQAAGAGTALGPAIDFDAAWADVADVVLMRPAR